MPATGRRDLIRRLKVNIPGHILYTFARLKVLEIYILTISV